MMFIMFCLFWVLLLPISTDCVICPNDPITALNLAVLHDRYLRQPADAVRSYERLLQLTDGKAEYDSIRRQAAFRLDTLKGR